MSYSSSLNEELESLKIKLEKRERFHGYKESCDMIRARIKEIEAELGE